MMPEVRSMRVLLVAGLADSLVNFRGQLIQSMLAKGYEVHVAAPDMWQSEASVHTLRAWGAQVHETKMDRTGKNPLADLQTLWVLWQLMRKVQPAVVLGYTIKPVIFGTIAAWLAGVPKRVALITGLGFAFQGERGAMLWVVQKLYAYALRRAELVFFQNPDDLALFRERNILSPDARTCVVNGSGVDVTYFAQYELPRDTTRFLLIARLLGAKGVREYAQAAELVKKRYPNAQFAVVGWIDSNPDAISQNELDQWVSAGTLVYWGRMSDVRPAIQKASVYVLPSYREGTPRSVLEAMSMGRAVITTDAPGCRETVTQGDNGYLVPVKSVTALAEAMLKFLDEPTLVEKMGHRSRSIAVEKYDVHKVNAAMMREMGIL
jgi:glycosyltransferase involved in cell wall biosynthesis